MCEYCGCRAVAAIAEPTREHGLVVGLIAEVRVVQRATGGVRMARAARRIEAVLAEAADGTPVDPTWPGGVLRCPTNLNTEKVGRHRRRPGPRRHRTAGRGPASVAHPADVGPAVVESSAGFWPFRGYLVCGWGGERGGGGAAGGGGGPGGGRGAPREPPAPPPGGGPAFP